MVNVSQKSSTENGQFRVAVLILAWSLRPALEKKLLSAAEANDIFNSLDVIHGYSVDFLRELKECWQDGRSTQVNQTSIRLNVIKNHYTGGKVS